MAVHAVQAVRSATWIEKRPVGDQRGRCHARRRVFDAGEGHHE
jgi:hypothetical protein